MTDLPPHARAPHRRPRFRTGVIVVTGAAVVAVVAYLLLANYRSAVTVREHLVVERSQQVRARAASLGFFFTSAAEDLRYLAESREVAAFHENRGLGMSMQYGLALSIVPIRERLVTLVEGAPKGPASKFLRIAVIDDDGTVLAQAAAPEAPPWNGHLDGDDGRTSVRLSPDGRELTLVRPHRFKGRDAGRIVAWLRPEAVLGTMEGGAHDRRSRLRLEDASGHVYRPDPEAAGAEASADRPAPPVVRAAIPDQALWLAKPLASPLRGELSPEVSALNLAIATAAVLVVLVLAVILNMKALVLEARLEESLRRERAVAEKHAALEQETAERQRLEEQLRHAQKLEAVGTLAGGVAHDFNNLLTAIQVNASFALDGLAEEDPVRGDVAEIQKAARRAVELTKQLLAFSRKQVLKPEVLDVNAVVAGIEKMLRSLLGEKTELVIEPAAELRRVRVDPGQLEQVILNLAVNARDAMPEGGRLTISTADVDVSEAEALRAHGGVAGPCVRIAVADEGQGMSPEILAHIFEPFFTTKAQGKGTGLGLATVYGIVRQSRGFIQVRSAPRGGTTFEIYLPSAPPLALAPAPPPAATVTRARSGRGETVLVAEDERQVRDGVQRQLAAEGYQVLVAADGREALEMAEAHAGEIDVLLSDVVMPHLSGPDLARQFRERNPDAVVIFMSGYSEEAVVRQGDLGDRSAFVQKPYSPSELAGTIRRLLDQSAIPPPAERHAAIN